MGENAKNKGERYSTSLHNTMILFFFINAITVINDVVVIESFIFSGCQCGN